MASKNKPHRCRIWELTPPQKEALHFMREKKGNVHISLICPTTFRKLLEYKLIRVNSRFPGYCNLTPTGTAIVSKMRRLDKKSRHLLLKKKGEGWIDECSITQAQYKVLFDANKTGHVGLHSSMIYAPTRKNLIERGLLKKRYDCPAYTFLTAKGKEVLKRIMMTKKKSKGVG